VEKETKTVSAKHSEYCGTGLVAQGNAGIGKHAKGTARLGGELDGVIRVNINPERVVLAQDVHEVGLDALGQHDGRARTDADNLHKQEIHQKNKGLKRVASLSSGSV